MARADRETGEITDGKNQSFRCFAASMEWNSAVRTSRWRNFELLKAKSLQDMAHLIDASLPKETPIIRIHVSGDFFSETYFQAWLMVAANNPDITFYAYTKSLHFWVANMKTVKAVPNFRLVASEGGRWDHLIKEHGLRSAKVVLDPREAEVLGLAIDHDDSHAYGSEESFALLLHGTQAKGTPAAKALASLRSAGWKGYSKAD